MFMLGFLCGAAVATWFILYEDGDLLIRLGEHVKRVSRRYHDWVKDDW